MEKARRSPPHREGPGLFEDGSPHPQGAPRGLLHFYSILSIGRRPMRGYDIMKEIEARTEGAWRPGPGAVYPVLQKLAKQGYIKAQKKERGGSAQVLYQITPAGLENIANAKKMMKSSTERLNLMGRLFIELMEPDDLVRFALNSSELQIELVHMIVESDRSGLGDQDRLFILRQHRLNLERELTRTTSMIKKLDGRSRSGSSVPEGSASEGKEA